MVSEEGREERGSLAMLISFSWQVMHSWGSSSGWGMVAGCESSLLRFRSVVVGDLVVSR